MVLAAHQKERLWSLHWAGLDDTVWYYPATDAADAANTTKPAFLAKQDTHPCSVLDRATFGESGGFFETAPGETIRTLVLKRTAPRPKGKDRYWWPSAAQWLEVISSVPPGTNGPVLYVSTRDITQEPPA